MKIILFYALALFISPFIAGGISFTFMFIFSPLSQWLKNKSNTSFDVLAGFESAGSVFITILVLMHTLNIFNFQISWLFVSLFVVYFFINDFKRLRATRYESLEVFQSVGNVFGAIVAGIYYIS